MIPAWTAEGLPAANWLLAYRLKKHILLHALQDTPAAIDQCCTANQAVVNSLGARATGFPFPVQELLR
jgi:hypothetical protein